MSRYGNKFFYRNDEFGSEGSNSNPSWVKDYEAALSQKEAVKSKEEDQSLFDQINAIIGNKSKYSTVDEAVKDLSKRTGLETFLNRKQASEEQIQDFQNLPALKTFIDNYTEQNPGTSIEATVQALLNIPEFAKNLPFADDVSNEVKTYIQNKIHKNEDNKYSIQNNPHLGKQDLNIDNSLIVENNPFNGLLPKGQ